MNSLSRFASRVASRHARAGGQLLALALLCGTTACALGGDDSPGCRTDHPEDCGQGWTCRAGVCFRPTTALTPAGSADADAAEATGGGDAADALEDAAPDDAPPEGG